MDILAAPIGLIGGAVFGAVAGRIVDGGGGKKGQKGGPAASLNQQVYDRALELKAELLRTRAELARSEECNRRLEAEIGRERTRAQADLDRERDYGRRLEGELGRERARLDSLLAMARGGQNGALGRERVRVEELPGPRRL